HSVLACLTMTSIGTGALSLCLTGPPCCWVLWKEVPSSRRARAGASAHHAVGAVADEERDEHTEQHDADDGRNEQDGTGADAHEVSGGEGMGPPSSRTAVGGGG